MDWDWQFLTPSSTPTNTSLDNNSALQTPALNAHFQDAFSPYLDSHQHHQPSAALSGPPLDFGDGSFFHQDINTHTNAYPQTFVQQQTLHPAFVSQDQPALAPAAIIGKEQRQDAASTQAIHPTPPDLYQIRTPPPTRGSSTRRNSQPVEPVVFGTPSSIRRSRPPDHHHHHHQQQQQQQQQHRHLHPQAAPMSSPGPIYDVSPSKMPHLALSQPLFHFPHPSAAPQQPFLDAQPGMAFFRPHPVTRAGNRHAWAATDDPFLVSSASSTAWGQPNTEPSLIRSHSLASGLGRTGRQKSRPLPINTSRNPNYGGHVYRPRQSPDKKRLAPASVDPTLVYSSPIRPATSDSMQSNPQPLPSSSASEARVPYQHSLKDPRQELGNVRSGRFRQPAAQNSPQTHAQACPPRIELQRSNTVTGSRSTSGQQTPESMHPTNLARSNSAVSLSRRTSPLKRDRMTGASLSSISETPKSSLRTSVVLTVDSNGRAATHVVEQSTREKYPSLWDESDSDPETPTSRSTAKWQSRNGSLTCTGDEERHFKVAKLDPPLEDLENLHLPRSNSSASLASIKTPSKAAYSAAAHLRRQSSAKKQQQRPSIQNRRNTLASLNSSFESLASVDPSTGDRPVLGDAGSALRQMMASRGSSSADTQVHSDSSPSSARKPRGILFEPYEVPQKSQSFAAPVPMQNYVQGHDRAQFPFDCAPMQPPTQSLIPSPTHSADYTAGPMFRCICNFTLDDGRGAVVCGFCNMFLHAACLGMDPQRLPPSYICHFCTNSANMLVPDSTQAFAGWGLAGI